MKKTIFSLTAAALALCAGGAFCKDKEPVDPMAKGIEYARTADYPSALKSFDEAAIATPQNSKVFFNRAIVQLKLNNEDMALADFKKACSLTNVEGCKVAAQIEGRMSKRFVGSEDNMAGAADAFKNGNTDEALSLLDKVEDKFPSYPDLFFLRGRIYWALHKPDKAISALDKAIKLKPSYADAYFLRGTIRRSLKQTGKAQTDLDHAIELNSSLPLFLNERGDLLRSLGKTDEAVADFQKAVALSADNVDSQYGLGMAYKEKGDMEKARPAFEKACMLKKAEACSAVGELEAKGKKTYVDISDLLMDAARYQKKGKYDAALEKANEALTQKPDSYEALMLRGHLYFSGLHDDEKALADFSAALEIKPDSLPARTARSYAYKNEGKLDEALADLNYAVKSDPADYKLLAQRAGVYLMRKEYKKSIADYKQAISLRDKDPELYFGLANACKDSGDRKCAKENIAKSCDMGFKTACIYARTIENQP